MTMQMVEKLPGYAPKGGNPLNLIKNRGCNVCFNYSKSCEGYKEDCLKIKL